MLSVEEKKAIEYWKTHMEILHWNTQLASEYYIKVLLDLVDKQSKEIEEAEQKEKKAYIDGTNAADKLCNKKWKDKIKAKIEALKAIADNGANAVRFAMTHEDEIEIIQKQKDIGTMVEVLQSLLEKE